MSVKRRRCPACGRQRKYSHEWRVGTDQAYSPNCKTYEQWKAEQEKKRSATNN